MKYSFVLLLLLILSCDSNEVPTDFSIKVDHFGEHYDSKTGIYIRNYNFKEKSVKIFLSQKQKSKIYNLYNEIDFLSFPTEFECDTLKPGGTIPSFYFEIEVTANGIIKSSGRSSKCDKKIEIEKEKKLEMFFDEITKIIENDKAYKSLPKSDRISL